MDFKEKFLPKEALAHGPKPGYLPQRAKHLNQDRKEPFFSTTGYILTTAR